MKVKYVYIKALNLFKGIIGFFSNGLLLNYCIEKNAGDLFNVDYPLKALNKRVYKYSFGKKKHFLFCGSILGRSNQYSTIVGAGFISKEHSESEIVFDKIVGVRGMLTANALSKANNDLTFDFLGDPGLLAREIVEPRNAVKVGKIIGVIPHFIDLDNAKEIIGDSDVIRIIDIRDDFISICNQILECNMILSSSLHGLIFSDSMNVPNVWIKFNNSIIGGDFKFQDYYSVMTNPKISAIDCFSVSDLYKASLKSSVSENIEYDKMKSVVNNCLGQI